MWLISKLLNFVSTYSPGVIVFVTDLKLFARLLPELYTTQSNYYNY